MKRFFPVLTFILLGFSQPASAERVVYSEADRAEPKIAFFMDGQGSLYPPADINIDYTQMVSPRPAEDFSSLKALFRDKSRQDGGRDWQAVLVAAGVPRTQSFEADWDRLQAVYRAQAAARIEAAAADMDQVVLLIHGFNNDHREASQWYDVVEEEFGRFLAAHGQKAAFVRMYWDGLSGNPVAIWTAAQANGPWVGLELRRVLNALPATLPLRVFTHSSGAFVMTNALGDNSSAFPDMGTEYRRRAAGGLGYEIPMLSNVRIAMLVPAQPVSAFAEFVHEDGSPHGLVPKRLILGTSRHDFATGKGRAFTSCRWYGATCMTTAPKTACERTWGDLGKKPMLVDFSQKWWGSHDHAVIAYMHDPQWRELTRGLLLDEPGVSQADGLCRQPVRSRKLRRAAQP